MGTQEQKNSLWTNNNFKPFYTKIIIKVATKSLEQKSKIYPFVCV